MAKVRIGHFVEAQILEGLEVDCIDESEVLTPADEEFQFFNRSWFQTGKDGTVRVGALLPLVESATGETVRLPRIGEP